jgi:hypothetical protein
LKQLIQREINIPKDIRAEYLERKQKRPLLSPSYREIKSWLCSKAATLSKLFIVLDALDEYSDEGYIQVKLLSELQKLRPTPHLLITSRPNIASITQTFPDAISLHISATFNDIKAYLQNRIQQEANLRRASDDSQSHAGDIINDINRKAKGRLVSHFQIFLPADNFSKVFIG